MALASFGFQEPAHVTLITVGIEIMGTYNRIPNRQIRICDDTGRSGTGTDRDVQ